MKYYSLCMLLMSDFAKPCYGTAVPPMEVLGITWSLLGVPKLRCASCLQCRCSVIARVCQDAADQVLLKGFQNGSDKIFHMACKSVLEHGHPQIVYATRFAAQLVLYKLGEAARRKQLAWFHSAAGHEHWQVARGYWFECMAHPSLVYWWTFSIQVAG